jgi:hypothetical protein
MLFICMITSAITPWYVGKAEYQSFKQEIFTHHKLIYYNEVLLEYERGEPLIYLIPRFSPKGRLGKPGKNNSVQFLETLLIGMALRRNDDIKNIKGTALLKTLQVHGVINSDRKGHPGDPAVQLKAALGIGA